MSLPLSRDVVAGDIAIPVLLPPSGDLTEAELCGRCCTWCSAPLVGDASVDLGERNDETGRHIFPRGCPPCTVLHAHRQLLNHAGSCEQCADDGARCQASSGLRRALREGRRP